MLMNLLLKFFPAQWQVLVQIIWAMMTVEQTNEDAPGASKLSTVLGKIQRKFVKISGAGETLIPLITDFIRAGKELYKALRVIF